jgi:hypothetical protein
MALSGMQKSLCNSLVQKFDPLISPIHNAEVGYRNLVADFSAQLRSKKNQFVDPLVLTQAVTDLQGQVQEVLPGDSLTDMEQLKDFISNCDFLSGANPVGTILGGTLGVFGKIDGFIDGFSGTIPEIGLGKLADAINRVLSGASIPGGGILSDLFLKADLLINCLAGCGPEYAGDVASYSGTIDGLYDVFNVEKNPVSPNYGKFNFTSVYSSAGLTPAQVSNMTTAVTGITNIKNGASSSILSSVNKAKSLIKLGGFF